MKKRIKTADLPAIVASQLRDLVTRGVFSPGFQLRQVDLAERFKVSRVPVREALKLLTAEGVVAHDPNRGFFVASLSSDEARQLYRLRHLLESELLSSVEWPTKEKLARFNAQTDTLDQLRKNGNRAEWAVRHREFYEAIFDLSPQKVLAQEVLRLLRLTDRYRSLGPMPMGDERDVQAERHLVKALASRNRDRLLRVFEEDRTRIEEQLVGTLFARGM